MWTLGQYLKAALLRCSFEVGMSRTEQETPSPTAIGTKAKGYDLFISEHSNATDGTGTARGVEVYYSVQRAGDQQLAASMSAALAEAMGNPYRGAKTRVDAAGQDYYAQIRAAAAVSVPHIILVENGFHDNAEDCAFLLLDKNLQLLAEIQAKVICNFLGVPYIDAAEPVHIRLNGALLDMKGVIIDNLTYAPIRAIAEALGCSVAWEAAERTVDITKIQDPIYLTLNGARAELTTERTIKLTKE